MRQCMDADNLHRRLRKIIGQVQAIDRMVDEDVPCEDILAQINAAKSALHRAGQVVLEGHLQHCVRDGIEHGDAEKTIQNFAKAVERRKPSRTSPRRWSASPTWGERTSQRPGAQSGQAALGAFCICRRVFGKFKISFL